ncbi:MAG: hypothetical protein PF569_07110 [Candidatus Woesearchaeota archaeon]|jgi:ABC-type hemin transport system substrate-binding protein|nr:hypothetical protein [Candidatus Woesearchaeota archaeon]
MQNKLNQKIILHNIKGIRENLDEIEKISIEEYNLKTQKKILKIQKELEKMEFYHKLDANAEKLNFPIKKQITIKNKKKSNSFANWLFNNNEI